MVFRAAFMVTALIATASCMRDRFEEPSHSDGKEISLIVNEAEPMVTKAAEPDMELIFSQDSMDLYIEVSEKDMNSPSLCPQTKGAPVEGNDIGEFNVSSFLHYNGETRDYFNIALNSNGSSVGTGYYWPISTPPTTITFLGYAKNQATGDIASLEFDPIELNGSFNYTLPAATEEDKPTDATVQPDILVAIAPDQSNTGNPVNLNFHHALSAIAFKVGDIPADFRVESVEFTNLPEGGNCEFAYRNGIVYEWEASEEKRKFTQTFEKLMSDGQGDIADPMVSSKEQTFMMIPGEIPSDSELIIHAGFQKDGEPNTTYDIRLNLKSLLATWKPGKVYSYKISSPEEVDVEVEDDVVNDGSKKENLSISNTGLAASYMRAMLVGYWVRTDENGNDIILGQWKQPSIGGSGDYTPDGVFESAALEADWFIDSNGFYYYRHPVPAGEKIPTKLFESYTLTGTPPAAGAELVLSIAVQAVKYDKIGETGWPVTVVGDQLQLKNN